MSYYFSPSGNDTTGDGSIGNPWATVAKANSMIGAATPGTQFLFLAGNTWNEAFTLGDVAAHSVNGTAAQPIVISSYQSLTPTVSLNTSALFTLDEQNARPYCVSSISPAVPVNGLVVSGIECKHATTQGIAFRGPGNKILVPWQRMFQNISIVGNYVHNDGAGCAQTDGPCVGNDPGGYVNQVVLEDDGLHPHSVYIARNKVQWNGGHNCIQVHGDTGSPIVDSNTVGPGCVHGLIDEKMVGDYTQGYLSQVTNNWLNCGFSQGLCGPQNFGEGALFTMNVSPTVNENILFQENVAFDLGGSGGSLGINIHPNAVPSGCPVGAVCPIQAKAYNNTLYAVRGQPQSIGIGETAPGSYGASSLDVRNNIIDGFGQSSLFVGAGMTNAIEDYNDVGGSLGSPGIQFNGITAPGPHSLLNVDPLYMAAPGNFQLKTGSPVVGKGVTGLPSGNANIGVY